MRRGTFPPPPPLEPLPPPLRPSSKANQTAPPIKETIDLRASLSSDMEIWKAGLDGNKGEMDVVFGELKPDQFLGKMLVRFPDPSRSIIIPSHQRQGGKGDNMVTELKCSSSGPFRGALNSRRDQLPGIKNSRFREYLKRYFPRENVVMQPLENVIRSKFKLLFLALYTTT